MSIAFLGKHKNRSDHFVFSRRRGELYEDGGKQRIYATRGINFFLRILSFLYNGYIDHRRKEPWPVVKLECSA